MKHLTHLLCISLGCLLVGGGNAFAQMIPAWTRQLNPLRWQAISRQILRPTVSAKIPFMDLSHSLPVATLVKTNDQNWIRHKVFYSSLFSRLEKEILLTPAYPQATLGKTVYLHDKNASFYNQLTALASTANHVNSQAFAKHQQILKELAGSLQQYYKEYIPLAFSSAVFSQEEIQRILQTSQPAAYVLTPNELHEFAHLPTLQAQQNWTERKIKSALWQRDELLTIATEDLSPAQFAQYYQAQSRLSYLRLLSGVLAQANQKRFSAIIRYKVALPGTEEKLTDAARGGKLLFENTNENLALQVFLQKYGPYAAAEALQMPYEIALQYGANAPELLGWQEGQRLRQLPARECLQELLPKILALQTELSQLRQQTPTGPSFYVAYYARYAQLQIYQTLTVRARLVSAGLFRP